jgi:hypothetical protein
MTAAAPPALFAFVVRSGGALEQQASRLAIGKQTIDRKSSMMQASLSCSTQLLAAPSADGSRMRAGSNSDAI